MIFVIFKKIRMMIEKKIDLLQVEKLVLKMQLLQVLFCLLLFVLDYIT